MTNEFKVGQAVSGHDYDNLPLGAQVTLGDNWFTHTKISGNRWRNDIGRVEPSGKYRSIARTLTHLPDATQPEDTETFFWDKATGKPCPRRGNLLCALPHDADHRHEHRAEPEDATDAYVEPEPRKNAAETLAKVTDALREYEEQHPAMFDSEGETARCFGGWLSDRGINLIGPSQAAPNRKPETGHSIEETAPTLPTHADFARACKNLADALRPAAEAAERAVEQMMRIVREDGAS